MTDQSTPAASRGDELKRALVAIRDLRRQVRTLEERAREPIAIIGTSCRLPGGADTPERFWSLLRDGIDATCEVPADRWDNEALYDPDPDAPGRVYTRRGGFLRDPVDQFDAAFFGISPREAAAMDPVQRLLLELSWEALERAYIPPLSLDGSKTGVFVGVSGSDYDTLQHHASSLEDIHTYRGTGTAGCVAGGRISHVLGLQGPNVSVDTACSSSLTAVALAVESLRGGHCDLALAGGAHLMLAPESTVYLCRMRALSPSGQCRTFDADADGYARGEGGGMFVLKRLSSALADGDPVLAVIRGAAVNHDGHSSGLTVPNPAAQRAVIASALANGGLAPADVDYVEAHGTATPLGDPIEVRAMADVLSRDRPADRPLLIGSVKTNFGHLEAASGAAGLLKLVLSLQHDEIPPHLHVGTPTPHIDWDRIPVRIASTSTPWLAGERPRVAGVSAFGFSGTNAHVIVEGPPPVEVRESMRRAAELVLVSGRAREAVRDLAGDYAAAAREAGSDHLAELAATSIASRSPLPFRAAAVGADAAEMAEQLEAIREDEAGAIAQVRDTPAARIAFLFTGQGSQYPGMGRDLYEASPVAREALDRCAEILGPHLDRGLLDLLLDEPDAEVVQRTEYAQPALFALEYALATLWMSWGVRPSFVAGHSLGEYVAAVIAGVMTLEDALPLVALRGRLMQALPDGGKMAAVLASESIVVAAVAEVDGVSIASLNGPENTVISGAGAEVDRVVARLGEQGVQSRPLHVSHAFHSVLMEPMLDDFESAIGRIALSPPTIPLISNLTSQPLTAAEAVDPRRWRRHIREAVRFHPSLQLLHEKGVRTFLEIGPHPALSAIGTGTIADPAVHWLPSLRRGRPGWAQILATLGEFWKLGHEVDLRAFDRQQRGGRAQLPTYAFQRERHWYSDSQSSRTDRAPARRNRAGVVHPLLGTPLRSPAIDGWVFETELTPTDPAYLDDHRVGDRVIVPGAALLEMMIAAGRSGPEWPRAAVRDLMLEQPLLLDPDGPTTVQVIVANPVSGLARARIVARPTGGDDWTIVASATLLAEPSDPAPSQPDLTGLQASHPEPVDIAALYDGIARRGIDYGPAFHSLVAAWTGEAGALGRAELAPGVSGDGYILHPTLVDAGFHLLASLTSSGEDESATMLPVGIDAVRVLGEPGTTCWITARVRPQGGSSADELVADLEFLDTEGRAVAILEGFRGRRIRSAPGARSGERTIFDIEWEEIEIEPPVSAVGPWLVVDGGDELGERLVAAFARAGLDASRVDQVGVDGSRSVGPEVGGIVDLRSGVAGGAFDEAADVLDAVTQRCGALIDLLGVDPGMTDRRLCILTRGATGPAGPEGDRWAVGAALWGMLPVIRAEHPELKPRIIDLDPHAEIDPDALVAFLRSEIDEDRIVVREGHALVPRLVRGMAESESEATPATIAGANYRLVPERRGTLEAIRYVPVERADPGPDEVEVRIRTTGLNFRDVLNVLGMYPGDPGPPGVEFAGVVTRVGPGVGRFAPGDEVIGIDTGLFAAYATVPAAAIVPMPRGLTPAQAATIPLTFLSAEWGLAHAGALRRGERVLIHAAAGGVGQAAVQIARAIGARIFATAGSEEKRDFLREQGIEHVFDSRSTSFADDVLRVTQGEGVDVVLNSLTGELLQRSLDLLGPGGRFIELGLAELLDRDEVARTHPGVYYEAFQIGALPITPEAFDDLFRGIVRRFETGELTPLRIREFAPDQVIDAFRFMAQARHIGKVVIGSAQVAGTGIEASGAYLVTGATGGVGKALAGWLVEGGAGAVVLNARRPPDAEATAWADRLADSGAQVLWVSGDAARREDVDAMIAAAASTGLPLKGIFHAAGVLEDGLLRGYDRERLRGVLAPKVAGALNLEAATATLDLDHFVLFSSTAALLGGPGQGSYAAANAVLGALARRRRARGLAALCVDWGAWGGEGMATRMSERERAALRHRGLAFLDPSAALATLGRLMEIGAGRIMVADISWNQLTAAVESAPPLLRKFVASREAGAGSEAVQQAGPRAISLASLHDMAPAERENRITEYVVEALGAVLGLRPGRIDAETSIGSMGFDSLMAMELRNRIETDLGIVVPVAALLQASSPLAISSEVASIVTTSAGSASPTEDVMVLEWSEGEI